MPPHAERNTPDHAHKSQDRSIRLPASSCTTTICRSPSRGVDGLRSHPRASRGRSMQDPASELPRISLPRTPVNKGKDSSFGRYFAFPEKCRLLTAPLEQGPTQRTKGRSPDLCTARSRPGCTSHYAARFWPRGPARPPSADLLLRPGLRLLVARVEPLVPLRSRSRPPTLRRG